ncbi:MAG: uL30 family ribosomal protein [Nanoarchaeota archaeon]|nr:uL30 family ribosomal protein [Nanoarchaeota archaeon]MBU4086566.1 uL30 family ribosomal protein [Nanoarchaeota archaeon]
MIAIIRISGIPEMPLKAGETLDRMRLRRKYCCVLLSEEPENLGMIKRAENFIAYGKIDKETLVELIKARGKTREKKIKVDAEQIAKELLEGKIKKKLIDFGLKPFFRLHPPRGGIDSKTHYPRGVLGDNKEDINKLIRRML